MSRNSDPSRRTIVVSGAAGPLLASSASTPLLAAGAVRPDDEAYWGRVKSLFDPPPEGVIQLENGQFGAMTRSTRTAYEGYSARINRETTLYTRAGLWPDLQRVREKAAALLGVDAEEIVFTRGGTESMQTLIGGYKRLKRGDAVLYADLDYDSMQVSMAALARTRGVRVVRIDLPEPASRANLAGAYEAALKANPDVRLMLLTHLSHRTGLIPPVKEIIAMARGQGVDVLLDCGHALGQTEFQLRDLGVEFAGLNLHKWIGAPLGVGLVYIARSRIPDIEVSPLEEESPKIDARVHTGTVNYAAVLAVSDAIDAHHSIGPAAKAARLRWLRDRWVSKAREIPGVQVLTPDDRALHAGITSFRLAALTTLADAAAVRRILFERHRIFTVERAGPAKGACVRVTPSFVNGPADVDALAAALNDFVRT